MNVSDLLSYCMDKPGAEQVVHNDWKATQIKVDDVLLRWCMKWTVVLR